MSVTFKCDVCGWEKPGNYEGEYAINGMWSPPYTNKSGCWRVIDYLLRCWRCMATYKKGLDAVADRG